MPLFRFHRGGLEESLKTTIIVDSMHNLLAKILLAMNFDPFDVQEMKYEPYPDAENNFDARIGWYTHIVMLTMSTGEKWPIGFLSEPFQTRVIKELVNES